MSVYVRAQLVVPCLCVCLCVCVCVCVCVGTTCARLMYPFLSHALDDSSSVLMGNTKILRVNWCFEPSQPLGIISGLKKTFIKRYIVERTNKAEIKPEEQSEKMETRWENLWNEIQLKGP